MFVDVDHPRFRRAQREIFTATVTPDCLGHTCCLVGATDRPPRHPDRLPVKLDACCQYGADIDLSERDGVLAHADEIRALLRTDARDAPWFTDEVVEDPDFPSGRHVRTATFGGGCVFLQHDLRGCAIHRAAVEGGWELRGIKPHVCRLFPLTYESDALVLSDDYADYSCAYLDGQPSVYRTARDVLAELFGGALVRALDDAEARVMAQAGVVSLRRLASRTP